MRSDSPLLLQILVFALVTAAFTTIYITQPVLPVLRQEFSAGETLASYTIAAVVLGIALSNLPFGMVADRFSIKPIILTGGIVVAGFGLLSAAASSLALLIAARFVQGLFIPALTTCLAAFLARRLPVASLNVVMGSYVSATVAGGLGGRLLGGWLHPPFHWRYALVSASILVLAATLAAVLWLPRERLEATAAADRPGIMALMAQRELLRIYLTAFSVLFVFSPLFNYLPFYLTAPPFSMRTETITMIYLVYVTGIIIGPMAGKLAQRFGDGLTTALGAVVFAVSIGLTLIPSVTAIVFSLVGVCIGFFTIHAAAAGSLNRRLSANRGRANSLYVLFYYLGGAAGITLGGQAFRLAGWAGVAGLGCGALILPFVLGLLEHRRGKKAG
jgi:YNFM family putative membrane transporter